MELGHGFSLLREEIPVIAGRNSLRTLQGRSEGGEEDLVVKWLIKVGTETDPERLLLQVARTIRGDEHRRDWDMVIPYLREKGQTVFIRQAIIDDHGSNPTVSDYRKGFLCSPGRLYRKTRVREHFGKNPAHILLIIDDQDCHRFILLRSVLGSTPKNSATAFCLKENLFCPSAMTSRSATAAT